MGQIHGENIGGRGKFFHEALTPPKENLNAPDVPSIFSLWASGWNNYFESLLGLSSTISLKTSKSHQYILVATMVSRFDNVGQLLIYLWNFA